MATGIERLHFMIGDWDIQAQNLDENGQWYASPVPNETRIEPLFDGAFVYEQVVPIMAGDQLLRFFIMWSYDSYRQVYRMLACDDKKGLMDIFEGNYQEHNVIVVSNQHTGTAVLDDGEPVYARLSSTQISDDSFADEISESYDGGETWIAIYRALHTRKR